MAFSHSPKIVTDGLVLCLDAANTKSYPGSGTAWKDLSGNGYNGTLTNGPAYSSDNVGSLDLDGTNDHVLIDNPTSYAGPYTVLMWVKPDTPLLSGGSGAGKPSGANRKTPLVGPGPVWNPGIWITSDYIRSHADTQYVDSAINWTSATWDMLGMTYDGTNVKNILSGNILSNAYTTSYNIANPTTLLIGAENTSGNGHNWNGKIGSIQIYDRVLTAQEIQQNYNATKGRFGL